MAGRYELPKKKKELSAVATNMIGEMDLYRNKERVRWLLCILYLQGNRNFHTLDWLTGTVTTEYRTEFYSDMDFKYEGLLRNFQSELGRLMQMDLRPSVSRRGEGLDGLRKASTAQVVLDDQVPPKRAQRLKELILPLYLKTGCVGVGAFRGAKDEDAYLEIIPPWELGSCPADPVEPGDVEVTIRDRWVTTDWLKARGLLGDVSEKDGELDVVDSPMGASPDKGGVLRAGAGSVGTRNAAAVEVTPTKKWVRFAELYQWGPSETLKRHVAMGGRKVLRDNDYSADRIPMPIRTARYLPTGGFYGRGFVEQLVSLNQEAEYMMDQLFRNVENFDMYGYLCVSTRMGLSAEQIKTARREDKVLLYEPDVYDPGSKPLMLTPPSNSGKAPLDIVQMCLGLMENQASQSDLLKGDAPGRVDNAKALNFLYETSNIPMTSPTESLAAAVSGAYDALLWLLRDSWPERRHVPMSLNDDALVGIQYDSNQGEVELERQAIPSPHEVEVSVASKVPRSTAQRKAELQEALMTQVITPREYRWKARVEGLDLPVGNEREWQNYRKAKLENIVMFGDGQTSGQFTNTNDREGAPYSDYDMHDVHIEVHHAFIARPEFYLASDSVRMAIIQHVQMHEDAMGMMPKGMPYPEEEAMNNALQMQAMQQAPPMAG